MPLPLVVIESPDEPGALGLAAVASRWHTGSATFGDKGQGIYFGDSRFRVRFTIMGKGSDALVEVWAQGPGHLTSLVAAAGRVTAGDFLAFREMTNLSRSYTLTLSAAGSVRLDLLHLVKYHYEARGIRD
ncbi:MAG: hypothetical protein AB1445_09640 [Bacillota bacterium]